MKNAVSLVTQEFQRTMTPCKSKIHSTANYRGENILCWLLPKKLYSKNDLQYLLIGFLYNSNQYNYCKSAIAVIQH